MPPILHRRAGRRERKSGRRQWKVNQESTPKIPRAGAARSSGLRPVAPGPQLPRPAEFVDVLGFREQELEERFALEAARLRDSEQEKVVAGGPLEERTRDLPLHGQLADGPLGHVVLPRDAILRQEREKAFAVA